MSPDRDTMNGRGEWLWRIGTAILAAVLTYGALSVRVSVLETRVDALREYVQEIRADVKVLLTRP